MPIHYTDPQIDVPPGVDFLDAEQVRAWVAACEVDKPWRDPMRRRFTDLVAALPPGARVLELGSGPGYLAESVTRKVMTFGAARQCLMPEAQHRTAVFSG